MELPELELKHILLLLIPIAVISLYILSTFSTGIAPDSPLYSVDTTVDNLKLTIELDPIKKATVAEDILTERLTEIEKMVDNGLAGWRLVLVGGTDVGGKEYLRQLKKQAGSYPIEFFSALQNTAKRKSISDLLQIQKLKQQILQNQQKIVALESKAKTPSIQQALDSLTSSNQIAKQEVDRAEFTDLSELKSELQDSKNKISNLQNSINQMNTLLQQSQQKVQLAESSLNSNNLDDAINKTLEVKNMNMDTVSCSPR
ncbi:hypothetical protein HZC07_03510 [Candidatus Micrarchaeota archaeon]|nr:hypothetical protein [Candidatus Micrarchaeota archaeon]